MLQAVAGTHRRWLLGFSLAFTVAGAACSHSARDFGTTPDASSGGTAGTIDDAINAAGAGAGGKAGGSSGASTTGGANQVVELGALGADCTHDAECAKGHCADGVCCETACNDSCHQCNLEQLAGTCSPVPDGQAAPPPHPSCATDDSATCKHDGLCDGAGSCRLFPNGTVCGGPSCSPATEQVVTGSHCDGSGSCVAETAVSCSPFKCDATGKACATSCTADQECIGQPCLQGSCGTVANGSVCTAKGQCQSGNCVDGYCCNDACTDACNACDITGTIGKCSQVPSGQPHGARPACAGQGGLCAGVCASGNKACTFDSSKVCSSASCSDGATAAASKCDGAGRCPSGAPGSCGGFGCNGGACYGACATDGQCASATPYCNAPSCSAKKPIGRTCSVDGDCTSTHCVQSACCATAANACGGCGALTGKPGDACGTCGKLACQGSALVCTGGGADNGCGGCDTTHHKADACGLCNNGAYACSGTSVVCQGATDNGCGGCDLTHHLADTCGTCGGHYACSGTTLACNGTDNGCGGCAPLGVIGGSNPALPHAPGMPCNSCSPAGSWKCSGTTDVTCMDNCPPASSICCFNGGTVCQPGESACQCTNFCE